MFTDNCLLLRRCRRCDLHSVDRVPSLAQRMTQMDAGHFVDDAGHHAHGERRRGTEFDRDVALVRPFAPEGSWLDIGCGIGGLLSAIQATGRAVEGIELDAERRRRAQATTGAIIHGRPIEHAMIPQKTFAVVSLINVFSHLVSPMETLSHIQRVLMLDGVLLLRTGVIGPGAQKHHIRTWGLGDHLHFLGARTLGHYLAALGMTLLTSRNDWLPDTLYTREWFAMRGHSRSRNLVKAVIRYTPGALPLLRAIMLRWEAKNPIHTLTAIVSATHYSCNSGGQVGL